MSLSHSRRKWGESGLEIERLTEASVGTTGNSNGSTFSSEKEKILWKNLLSWSLESRVLIRGLFEKILENRLTDVLGEVQHIKEKAEARALGLLELNEEK